LKNIFFLCDRGDTDRASGKAQPPVDPFRGDNVKEVLLDSSSAILMRKAGIFDAFTAAYRAVVPRSVYMEITAGDRPGASDFQADLSAGRLSLTVACRACMPDLPLAGGERDTVLLYLGGAGEFIVIDDGKGANYCRKKGIPYINALLVPRILFLAGRVAEQSFREATGVLLSIGRYAEPIIVRARECSAEELVRFFP
jgi:hypothetical protein